MEFNLTVWLNIGIVITAIAIAIVKFLIFKYIRTVYLLLIVVGFVYFAAVRVLIAMQELDILTIQTYVVGGGFILILIGSIGVLVFVRKSFIEAARLLKEKGVELPDTWKSLDERVERLKKKSDEHLSE
jgi:hypothetical protein